MIPVRDRKAGASSRNYRFSAHVQVIIDADIRLVVATARPAPGNRADAQVWRNSGLAQHCDGVTVLGDGAYISTGLVVPHRKRPGRPLLAGEEEDNAEQCRRFRRGRYTFARIWLGFSGRMSRVPAGYINAQNRRPRLAEGQYEPAAGPKVTHGRLAPVAARCAYVLETPSRAASPEGQAVRAALEKMLDEIVLTGLR